MTENRKAIIDEMLEKATTIAVVGISNKPERASYNIANYLAKHGYRVVPVNPALSEVVVNGATLTCYPTLEDAQAAVAVDIEASGKIDLVDVFRASDAVPAIVDDVIRLHIPYLWLQDGVQHDENDCIFREHAARS